MKGLNPYEFKFVEDHLAMGQPLRAIAAMLGRMEPDLDRAYRLTKAGMGPPAVVEPEEKSGPRRRTAAELAADSKAKRATKVWRPG